MKGAILGLAVADALGVPVEFIERKILHQHPVEGMRAFGTYDQPAGTWSDDTSMTLCLMDSLSNGLDYDDIMGKFWAWYDEAKYTPHGETFDVGIATSDAMQRYENGTVPLECGGQEEFDNGNGSLMRILPLLFYLRDKYGAHFTEYEDAFTIIHRVSSLTHAHKRSQLACGVYLSIASFIAEGEDLESAVKSGIQEALKYYKKHEEFMEELTNFERICSEEFTRLPEERIYSSGYVIDTMEAAIWCLLNTTSYGECVLKAVNLGEDTDTVAAVAGGLAGLHYGYASIPEEWLHTLVKRDYIERLCGQFYKSF